MHTKKTVIVPSSLNWPESRLSFKLPMLGRKEVQVQMKRIKSRTRSSMKNDLLNALIHILLNGPPVHSKVAYILLNKVTDIICQSMPLQSANNLL